MVSESETTTGVTLPYERLAMAGEEMPNGLAYPDQILFLELRMLYAQTIRGIIDREQAVIEKKKLLDTYRVHQFNDQMGKEWVQVIKQTELLRAAFRKNPSVETAQKLVDTIEGRNLQRILREG